MEKTALYSQSETSSRASVGSVDDAILRLKHIDVPQAFLLEHCYAKQDDIVIVAGTLVEGIGNECSDIDVYVITGSYPKRRDVVLHNHHRVLSPDRDIIREDTPDETDVFLIHTVVPGTSIKVDVEFKTFVEIDRLFSQIREIFFYARQNLFLLTKRLTDREEVLVHRFLNCRVIAGREQFEELRGQLPRQEFHYLGYRWSASDFNILLDLIGAWRAGEIDRAVEFARENVFLQTLAYLRLAGCTNPRRKWLLSYLRMSGDAQLVSEFLDLMYLRSADGQEGKMDYVQRSLDYVDRLFTRSRPYLEAMRDVPSGEEALTLLKRDRELTPLHNDYGTWEFAYRAKAYREDPTLTRTILGSFANAADDIRPTVAPLGV